MEPYKPVSCDFVDQIEIAALKHKAGTIRYLSEGQEVEIVDKIQSWETKDKVEYLIIGSGKRIRLDQILWMIDQAGPAADQKFC